MRSAALAACYLVISWAAAGIAVHAQESGIQDGTRPTAESIAALGFTDRAEVGWVVVPTVVRQRGRFVGGLGRNDFQLLVDRIPVAIENFDASQDGQLTLVYLQDLSGSMANGGKLETSRAALRCILDQMRPRDQISMVTFASGRVDIKVPATDQRQPLQTALEGWQGYGTTAIHDAVAWLPEIELLRPAYRGGAVLVTDGLDNSSQLKAHRAREIVRESEVPVYVIELGVRRQQESEPSDSLLKRLAESSGGAYFAIDSAEDVQQSCTRLLEELRSQYILGFTIHGQDTGHYHRIEVRSKARRHSVAHRRFYRGAPPNYTK